MILSLVSELLGRIARRPAIEEACDRLRRNAGEVRLAGLTDSAKALVAPLIFSELGRPAIVVVESNQHAEALIEPMRWFYRAITGKPERRVEMLPALDVSPYESRSPHGEILEDRAVALWRLATGEADLVIAPVEAALARMREPQFYRELARTIARDESIAHEDLIGFLVAAGYQRQTTCEMPGQFSVRGGIIDVFSPETPQPVRIELLGDTIESIRAFDPNTQRSTNPMERALLLPLTEFLLHAEVLEHQRVVTASGREDDAPPAGFYPGWEFREISREDRRAVLFDLATDPVVILDEPGSLDEAIKNYRASLQEAFDAAEDPRAEAPDRYILSDEEWSLAQQLFPRLGFEHLQMGREDDAPLAIQTQPTTRYHGNVPAFIAEVRGRLATGDQVMVTAASTGELERFADICHEYELPYRIGELEENTTMTRLAEEGTSGSMPAMVLAKAPLGEGIAIPESQLVIYGNADLFEKVGPPPRPRARPKTATFFSNLADLKPGDYVVHVDHGIGQFEGLRQVSVEGANGEFMLLKYALEAKLYVPLARLDLIQKYNSLGDAPPALDRLGTGTWEARKSRVRKSVSDMAEQLLALYAERKTTPAHAFPPDANWQREFEDAFEFQETPDQMKAIEDVKRDMESTVPMDRLLCGDVGYGKTEVAMRAAFKAVANAKQAAVLAPTTVLAFQHYETFKRRFAAFPVRIEMLSRFRNDKEQKKTIEELEAGKVDIVIGTHRLLSRDVKFHDLGVLIVDEEQRFGVAHKERLKEMRKNVHVLTMSATPIPRTLHMSLIGLRDMSVIETPPKDRLAIQTTVAPFTETLVQHAIKEEMDRGGQIFFVHNRVESITSIAAMVMQLAPKARVVVGHGQMRETELEKVMLKFVRGDADILISTTIVENGLDIPRANTIIINRADRMGLSELYQLRGRVGRSNQRAYAYLLVPPDVTLSGIARQRLAALKEFSDLGAGFRIAALDLELRGAGNLLGSEQHGHIEAVGFDMYVQMLERAVSERKGEAVTPERRATLNLGQEIRIPPEYIENENLRLRIYKRIAEVSTDKEREETRREMADRFGPPPAAVENLLDYAVLKALAEKLLVASVDRRGDQIGIKFYDDTPVGPERVVKMVRKRRDVRIDPSGVLWVGAKGKGGALEAVRNVLLQLQAQG
ncbi:MAG: transcription-repair coupling factor [Candidatus Acidiferrales bacterium]